MKRDIANAEEMFKRMKSDPLLRKQIENAQSLSEKEYAHEAVRLGRTRGLYFNETDWLHICPSPKMKQAA